MSQNSTKAATGRRLRPAASVPGIVMAPVMAGVLATGLAGISPVMAKPGTPANRGLESVHQPVVQHTNYVFDTTPDGYEGLSRDERRRVLDWFDAIELGYGDRVSIAGDGAHGGGGVPDALADLVGQYGLLLAGSAPRTAGEAPSGAVRIVVSRSTATVPGCPHWGDRFEADIQGGLSSEYGCAVNGNLAAMIANPDDLIQGRQSQSRLRNATSNRAIKAYNAATPTGGGGNTLK